MNSSLLSDDSPFCRCITLHSGAPTSAWLACASRRRAAAAGLPRKAPGAARVAGVYVRLSVAVCAAELRTAHPSKGKPLGPACAVPHESGGPSA